MKFVDALLGRTKPVAANLDNLFALPAAALSLECEGGIVSSNRAGVCFRAGSGSAKDQVWRQTQDLLTAAGGPGQTGPIVTRHSDAFGFEWAVVEVEPLEDLVTRVHMVNSTVESAGFSSLLLCSVFRFTKSDGGQPVYLVYLYKKGTFYPFVPIGSERRDSEMELQLRAVMAQELRVEPDLSSWFPLWGIPLE
jgi:hypothetical protein